MTTKERTNKAAKKVLIAARKLIEAPNHWIQKESARRADGKVVVPWSLEACQWCARGALDRVERHTPVAFHAQALLESEATPSCVLVVNDNEGHSAVLALYDKAIASCLD